MPITFACGCGKQYTVADELAGKRTACPACKSPLVVPQPPPPDPPADEFEVLDDEPVGDDFEVLDDEPVADDFEVLEDDPLPVIQPAAKKPAEPENDLEFAMVYRMNKVFGAHARTFRLYRIGRELLFLDAGPHFHRSEAGQARLSQNLAGMGAAGGAAGAWLSAEMERAIKMEADALRHNLDCMSLKELRKEAESSPSFAADADSVENVRFDEPSFFDAKPPDCPAMLRFTHTKHGKQSFALPDGWNTKLAIYKFVAVCGAKAVTVKVPFKKRRKRA